jgi:hypothetical protein
MEHILSLLKKLEEFIAVQHQKGIEGVNAEISIPFDDMLLIIYSLINDLVRINKSSDPIQKSVEDLFLEKALNEISNARKIFRGTYKPRISYLGDLWSHLNRAHKYVIKLKNVMKREKIMMELTQQEYKESKK